MKRGKQVVSWIVPLITVAVLGVSSCASEDPVDTDRGGTNSSRVQRSRGTTPDVSRDRGVVFIGWKTAAPTKTYVYRVGSDGTRRKRLTEEGNELDPRWSPDHRRIAFLKEKGALRTLWVMQADGSGERIVSSGDVLDFDWAPNSQELAIALFEDDSSDNGGIYIVSIGGDPPQRVSDEGSEPDFSPDGERIAFSATLADSAPFAVDVYVVNRDGTGLTNVTENPAHHSAAQPSWSPDGSRIALTNTIDDPTADEGGPYTSQVYVMNPDGTDAARISESDKTYKIRPTWNPVGSLVAYGTECDMDYCFAWDEIAVAVADGSEERLLTDTRGRFERGVAWSLDGSRLVFAAWRRSSTNSNLFTISPDGSDEERLVGDRTFRAGSPDW